MKDKTIIVQDSFPSFWTYAAGTLTPTIEKILGNFERNVLRSIFGGVQQSGIWRKRRNVELYGMFKGPDVVHAINLGRLKWETHVFRMNDSCTLRQILLAKPVTTRRRRKAQTSSGGGCGRGLFTP